jgi:hypothetical protein
MLVHWRAAGISRAILPSPRARPGQERTPHFLTAKRTPPYTPPCTPSKRVGLRPHCAMAGKKLLSIRMQLYVQ